MSGRDWRSEHAALADLVERQLFFIGGPPRSGTTWLQQIMNAHPDVSCMGEGLFQRHLADPLDKMIQSWGQALTSKNTRLFGHSGGYPLPPSDEADFLLRIAILRALGRQTGASTAQALGEKTPENVFLFPRLQRLFPRAKFIAIFRDPRDVLSSAWHFFRAGTANPDDGEAKTSFLRAALPSINDGARVWLSFARQNPQDTMQVSYEAMSVDAAGVTARLYEFIGVSTAPQIVAESVARTAFSTMTGGRPAGVTESGSFLRKGVVGDWRSTFTAEQGALVERELGWMFPLFGFSRTENGTH
jgi:LPS sulfotransferase NodH